ncbi:MAG: hypothetical protein M3362_24700, partial [Acidobacteriota bacterium]|nr:hypothetical protein [Acidobacteriota bacterium]
MTLTRPECGFISHIDTGAPVETLAVIRLKADISAPVPLAVLHHIIVRRAERDVVSLVNLLCAV